MLLADPLHKFGCKFKVPNDGYLDGLDGSFLTTSEMTPSNGT